MATAQFNLVPGGLDIQGVVGDDFSLLFDFNIDLTGYTFDARVIFQNAPRNTYEAFTITETNLSEGRITLSLTDTQTKNLGPLANAKWYISWFVGSNTRTVISGKFSLNQPWAVGDISPSTSPVSVVVETDTVDVTVIGGSGGIILWGDIQGDIEDQTDLIEYLQENYAGLNFSTYGIYTPEEFGGNGDLRTVYDVSTTASSSTVGSSTASFTSQDVGKTVVIHYSYAQDDYLITTIATVIGPTQITVASAPSSTSSNLQMEIGTDNTTAIQNAINAVITARGGVVQFQRKPYLIAGPLQYPTEVPPRSIYNSVLVVDNDLTNDTTKPLVTITFQGQGMSPVGYNDYGSTARPPTTNTVIYCPTKGSGADPSIISASHTIFNGSGSVAMFFQNITFRVPSNSSIHAINAHWSGSFQIEQCTFDTAAASINISTVPTGGMAAIVAGVWGNNAWQVIRNVWIIGYSVGIKSYEHTSMSDVVIMLCDTGVYMGTGSGTFIVKAMIQGCVNSLQVDPAEGTPNLHASHLELECRPTGPFAFEHFLDDPSKVLEGYIFGTITQGFDEHPELASDFSSANLNVLLSTNYAPGIAKLTRLASLDLNTYAALALGDGSADGAVPYSAEGLKIGHSTAPSGFALTKGGGTGAAMIYFPGPGNGAIWLGGYVAGAFSSAGATLFTNPAGGRTVVGGGVDNGTNTLQVTGTAAISSTVAASNLSGTNTGDQYGGVTAGSANLYLRRNAANTAYEFGALPSSAPSDATFITQTPSSGLSGEQALSALATGLLKNTTSTGVLTIAAAGTDYVAPSGSGSSLTGLTSSQIAGTTTNDNAAAGKIGEYVSSLVASGSAVSLTDATAANITSISLTAGDWDVEGNINFIATTATVTSKIGGISSTSATLPTDGSEVYSGVQLTVATATDGVALPRKRISIASTTTVYLVGQASFSAGTVSAFGSITARRVR